MTGQVDNRKQMRRAPLALFVYFARTYPAGSAIVLGAFLCAGLAEMLGIGALLPVLSIVSGDGPSESASALERGMQSFFSAAGIKPDFVTLLGVVVAAMIVKSAVIFATVTHVGYAAAKMADDMRVRLIRALMAAQWKYYTSLPAGKIANIMATEAQRVGMCYTLTGKTLASVIQVAVYLAAAFMVSWQISLMAMGAGLVLAVMLRGLVRMAGHAGDDFTSSMNTMMTRLTEALGGVKPIKAMGLGDRYAGLMEGDTKNVMKSMKAQVLAAQFLQGAQDPMAIITGAVIMYVSFTIFHVPLHELMLLGLLFLRLMTSVNLVQGYYQKAVLNESALWEMQAAIAEAEGAREVLPGSEKVRLNQGIKFDQVTLAHDGREIISGFSAEIPARKITVVFGPSGVGKTTLVDSILGLNRPAAGEIFIDGVSLKDADFSFWRARVGYVPQDTFLFHDTILNNITLGDPAIGEGAAVAALKEAAAWDFVQTQPQGIHTVVGERGGKLSGGQRQRIALARALVRKPDLLVLDEATTGLDRESEQAILNTLKKISRHTTIVKISHNPAFLDFADHKIIMGNAAEKNLRAVP